MDTRTVTDEEVFAAFRTVLIDQDNIEHYRGLLQRRLLINRCQDCGYWIYPHRPTCPQCWSWNLIPTEVSGKGTVYMFTVMHQVYQGSELPGVDLAETPLPLAAVELPERKGMRYLSLIVNCSKEDICIGMPVELVWMERDGHPAVAFQPAANAWQKEG